MKLKSAAPLPVTGSGGMKAKALFRLHLKLLRKKADAVGRAYLELLCSLASIPVESLGFGVYQDADDPRIAVAEERWRPRFYEWLADELLASEKSRDAEIRKAVEEETKRLTKGLVVGRQKGAEANKARAMMVQETAMKMNEDLRRDPERCSWSIPRRAQYVAKQLSDRTIRLNGKEVTIRIFDEKRRPDEKRPPDEIWYAVSTIERWIKTASKRR
jgi:hypothetical protein